MPPSASPCCVLLSPAPQEVGLNCSQPSQEWPPLGSQSEEEQAEEQGHEQPSLLQPLDVLASVRDNMMSFLEKGS